MGKYQDTKELCSQSSLIRAHHIYDELSRSRSSAPSNEVSDIRQGAEVGFKIQFGPLTGYSNLEDR